MVFNFKAVNRGEKGAYFQIENTWSGEVVNFGFLEPGAAARGQGNTEGTWLKYFRWDETGEWVQFGGTHSTRFAERDRDKGDSGYISPCEEVDPTPTAAPTMTNTPVPPTSTNTPVPPEPTATTVPPEPTDTPLPPETTDTPQADATTPPEETAAPTATLDPTATPTRTSSPTSVPTLGIPVTGEEVETGSGSVDPDVLIPVTGPEISIWQADPVVQRNIFSRISVNTGLVFAGLGLVIHGWALWRKGREEN